MNNNSSKCKCSVCYVEANSIAGTIHRRCLGIKDSGVREKYKEKSDVVRGRWELV